MPNQSETNKEFLNGFRELLQREKDPDWAAKLEHLCETFWVYLDHADGDAAPLQEVINAFLKVLLDSQTFFVARLVIPDFRSEPATEHKNLHKQYVMKQTAHLRTEQINMETTTSTQFDDPLYRAEKDIFAEAEMYRAGLLLYNRGNLGKTEREEFQAWWEARPGKMGETEEMKAMDNQKADRTRDAGVGDEDHDMEAAVGEECKMVEERGVKRQWGPS